MKILFVCNQGKHRSKTAAELIKDDFETKYSGIYTNINKEDLNWADLILVMEDHQRKEISIKFPKEYLTKQILCLDVPDIYSYNQPELISLLEERLRIALPILKT